MVLIGFGGALRIRNTPYWLSKNFPTRNLHDIPLIEVDPLQRQGGGEFSGQGAVRASFRGGNPAAVAQEGEKSWDKHGENHGMMAQFEDFEVQSHFLGWIYSEFHGGLLGYSWDGTAKGSPEVEAIPKPTDLRTTQCTTRTM